MLHTSDVHLSGGKEAKAALEAVVATALSTDVDIVLIAGDLFDHARVKDDVVDPTLVELARLDRPVVVIPGNHDCVDENSIYRRVDLSSAGAHVFFAGDPAGEQLLFADLSLAIWARGIKDHSPENRPLEGYRPADPGWWSVVITHGHYVAEGDVSDRSSPITQKEIGQLGCDYLALGHWHRFLDVSEGGVTAYYSGSPSEPRLHEASVNLVTLDRRTGVQVERLSIAPPP
jgi:exonuclease SbcD